MRLAAFLQKLGLARNCGFTPLAFASGGKVYRDDKEEGGMTSSIPLRRSGLSLDVTNAPLYIGSSPEHPVTGYPLLVD